MIAWTRAGGSIALFFFLGCGGAEAVSTPQPGTGTETPTPSGPSDVTPKARRWGGISLSESVGLSVFARFPVEAASRAQRTEGCVLERRKVADEASDSAGDIVIDVPTNGRSISTKLTYDAANRRYDPASIEADRLTVAPSPSGPPFRVRAAGATVPAFDAEIVPAPPARFLAPAEDAPWDGGDLVVRWDGGSADPISLFMNAGDDAYVSCQFASAAKSGVVPAALVKEVARAAAATLCGGGKKGCFTLTLLSVRRTKVSTGDFDIDVSHLVASHRLVSGG